MYGGLLKKKAKEENAYEEKNDKKNLLLSEWGSFQASVRKPVPIAASGTEKKINNNNIDRRPAAAADDMTTPIKREAII